MLRILCVCTGNTCRSPMFKSLLSRALAQSGFTAIVESAGTGAHEGEPASAGAIAAMHRRGLDLSAHRSQSVSRLNLISFDRIYTVSTKHAAHIRAQDVPPDRIAVLAAAQGGVPDPWGADDAAYEQCAALLSKEVDALVAELTR